MVDGGGGLGPVRQRRLDDADMLAAIENDLAGLRVIGEYRFLDHDNVVGCDRPGQKMLGALENEIPAQMRQGDQRRSCVVVHCEGHWAPGRLKQRCGGRSAPVPNDGRICNECTTTWFPPLTFGSSQSTASSSRGDASLLRCGRAFAAGRRERASRGCAARRHPVPVRRLRWAVP